MRSLTIPMNYRMSLLRWRVLPQVPAAAKSIIDGFTGGQLPPKSAIRAIIINQNPFSAQYDTPGYGRVEILTKPGTDKLHGQLFMNASASAFNTSNPFVVNEPPYHTLQYDGNVSGALGKKASFFFYFDRRNIQNNSIVNANVPYVPDPATCGPASGDIVRDARDAVQPGGSLPANSHQPQSTH